MPQNNGHGFLITLALGFSFIGIALVLPLAIYSPTIHESFSWRKPLIGSLLTLICLSGIFAAFFPEECSKTFHIRRIGEKPAHKVENASSNQLSIHFKGHHPDCGNFEGHLIKGNGRVLCAACIGLFIGALTVLAGTSLYFFVEWQFLEPFGLLPVLVGQAGVALGFFQFKFRGLARAMLNAFFVFSCFLILAAVDILAENLFLDLYLIGLTLFWLFTRIQVSQWNHMRICSSCKSLCTLKKEREN
ncbi:MAG: hypothetical protein ACPLKQ_06130 [Candidatus Bathyarchaeales archaeon]